MTPYERFWRNVRSAAQHVYPGRSEDTPVLDAGTVRARLLEHRSWLTPVSVAAYRPEDFEFLGETRHALTESVRAFSELARSVSQPGAVVPDDQVEAAADWFQKILEILNPVRYGDAESLRFGKLVEKELSGRLPAYGQNLRFRTGDDHAGNPGVWIWVILPDQAAETDEQFLQHARQIDDVIMNTVLEMDTDRFPYVSYRTESDLELLTEGAYS